MDNYDFPKYLISKIRDQISTTDKWDKTLQDQISWVEKMIITDTGLKDDDDDKRLLLKELQTLRQKLNVSDSVKQKNLNRELEKLQGFGLSKDDIQAIPGVTATGFRRNSAGKLIILVYVKEAPKIMKKKHSLLQNENIELIQFDDSQFYYGK